MKVYKILWVQVFSVILFISCNEAATTKSNNEKIASPPDTLKINPAEKNEINANDKTLSITAKFIDFSLGDIPHYNFIDKTGKFWDFTDNKETQYKFSAELPANKANETNQGWTSDKTLQGKWFNIKYTYVDGRKLTDGNMDTVAIILEAKMKQ